MNVAQLIDALRELPQDSTVMLDLEHGVYTEAREIRALDEPTRQISRLPDGTLNISDGGPAVVIA